MSKLAEIFAHKVVEVERAKSLLPFPELRAMAMDVPPARGFQAALERRDGIALIAEVKKASPSQGLIRSDFDPVAVARAYEEAGADCLSVLTDVDYFQGSAENLRLVRAAVDLPLLRKDFVADPYQIYEAKAWGADAILLIVAGLEDGQMADLYGQARELGLDILVEVHDEAETVRANKLAADLIGINNRDLSTFKTDLATSERLMPSIRSEALKVSESALSAHEDVARAGRAGAKAVLIGTAFCAEPDIVAKVREVMGR